MLNAVLKRFTPKPCPLASQLAESREAMAQDCARKAAGYAGRLEGIQLADEARQWREAAGRARRGDLSPVRIS